MVGRDHQAGARIDEGLVRLGLEHVGRGEARALVHAVDAEEDEVDVDVAQGAHGEGSDERVRGCAHPAGEDDGLVAATAVVEHLRCRHRVGHDGQARDLHQAPADLVGRAAGRDRHRHARLDHGRGRARDRQLGVVLERALGVEARLVDGRLAEQRGPAVDLDQVTLALEGFEITTHGHVGDVELAHEVRHAHGTISSQPLEDECVSLWRQHGAATSLVRRQMHADSDG